ncbi:MAG: cellulose biosynthesis cyclic di-GMP-binding regulatory protein BcsB [Ardenticatenaceae bacterium]|nr:cellulose biosynthesis cyclic di-GMP-binding regulatory protein BcsB [Ardenticatenaceae bacterium]
MKSRFLSLILPLLLLHSLLLAPPARPETQTLQSITLQDRGYNNVTLRGLVSSAEFFLPGPGAVTVEGTSRFRLHYSHTDTLLGKRSSLTVRLNGVDLISTPLVAGAGAERWLDVPLPPRLVKNSFNRVEVVFYLRYADDEPCTDPYNPALWATVYADSMLEYGIGAPLALTGDLDLASYPMPFYREELGPEPALHLVLPPAPGATTLTAATSLVARLGQVSRSATLRPILHSAATLPDAPAIAVGPGSAFPWLSTLASLPLAYDGSRGQFLDPQGRPIPPEIGVLQLVPRSRGGELAMPLLLVSGGNEEGVRRAGLTLAARSFTALLNGQYTLITDPPHLEGLGEDEIRAGLFTFGELRRTSSDPTVRGRGEHSISVPFMMPQAWQFDNQQAQATVRFSHAAGLDERSLLTVVVNGTAIGSTRLGEKNATGATLSLPIPSSVLRPGANTLAATFDMAPEDDDPCDFAFDETAWGTIHRDSTLELPFAEGTPVLDLSAFAAPFVQGGTLRETSVLLSPSPDPAVISQTLTLAARLGKRTTSDLTYLPVTMATEPGLLPNHHLIAVGVPGTLPLLPALKNKLPLQFDETGALMLQNRTTELLAVQTQAPVGVLQTGDSPWHRGRRVLLISGTTAEAVGWAVEATDQNSLSGNAAIVTREGRVATLGLEPTRSEIASLPPERQLPLWLAVIAGLVVIAFLVATAVIATRRRNVQVGVAHE